MRVAIVGSGAIGLLYGGWLQSAGLDVVFVTRPGRQAALDGATLTAEGRLSFRLRVSAVGDVANAGGFDAIILGVKLYDLASAAAQALPALAPEGALVAVQNGVSAYGILRPLLDPSKLAMAGVCGHAAYGIFIGCLCRCRSGDPRKSGMQGLTSR